MTGKEFLRLNRGDIIRPTDRDDSYLVDGIYYDGGLPLGGPQIRVVAVRTVLVTNPDEWERVTPDCKHELVCQLCGMRQAE